MKIILQEMLIRRGWNQRELSERSGVPQPMISQIITGDVRCPRVDTLYKLATALHCTVDDLIRANGTNEASYKGGRAFVAPPASRREK